MAVPGREPNPDSVNRNAKVDWTEVEDKPFTGKIPVKLPATRIVMTPGGPLPMTLEDATELWWETITRMPHCILWTPSDWAVALTTAYVADSAFKGNNGSFGELRIREDLLGVTAEARRKLRIRYVTKTKPAAKTKTTASKTSNVTNIDERRLRNRTA